MIIKLLLIFEPEVFTKLTTKNSKVFQAKSLTSDLTQSLQ